MPISLIAGNWKMNTGVRQARSLISEMKPALDAVVNIQTIVCPPFVSLAVVSDMLRGSSVGVGAQNMYHEDHGAFTGEVSPAMLAELCQFVILGHSERRQLFGDTDELVNLKVRAALAAGLRPVLCVGEQLQEREGGRAEATVEAQIRLCLQGVDSLSKLAVAYEPVWAIGTGKAATPDVAQAMIAHLRGVLSSLYGADAAADVPLLYGGSVNPGNVAEFMREADINGALVGGASLDAGSFVEIVRNASHVLA